MSTATPAGNDEHGHRADIRVPVVGQVTEAYVPYFRAVEQILDGEQQIIDQLGDTSLGTQQTVTRITGTAMRGTHAKATGLLVGELTVPGDLPPELAQGLFARPGRYDTLVRFSQGPPKPVPDAAGGQRGMAVKVLGVHGPHLALSRETSTQDWVLAPDPTFVNSTAATFLRSFRPGASKSPHLPDAVLVAASRLASAVDTVLQRFSAGSGNLRFLGRPPTHPVSHPYYSQAPVRFGDLIAKIAVFPTPATLRALGDTRVDTTDPDAFRQVMRAFFIDHDAEFELRAQLCTDLDAMPVEDASVRWPEQLSPFRTVARLVLPAQSTDSPARRTYFEQRLAFNPAHALEEHRPLGSINRARMAVYVRTQDYRQRQHGAMPAEPATLADVPD